MTQKKKWIKKNEGINKQVKMIAEQENIWRSYDFECRKKSYSILRTLGKVQKAAKLLAYIARWKTSKLTEVGHGNSNSD